MAVEDSVAQDQIRAFVERIERMESEKAAISADIKEIYAEAKGNGFDVKILRRVVGIRKQDANERFEQEALLELYMSALGMAEAPSEELYGGERERLNSIASQLRSEVKKPDPLAALRADPAMAIVGAADLEKSKTQPTKAAGQASNIATVDPSVLQCGSTSLPGAEGAEDRETITENQLSQPAGGDLAVPSPGGQVATHQEESLRDETPAGQGASARRDEAEETDKSAEVETSAAPVSKYAAPGVTVWEHTPPEPVRRHPYSAAFGEMGQDLAVIDDDIAGAKSEPIVRVGNEILDGWARYCTARGMIGGSGLSTEYPVKQYDGDNALVDCIRWNVTGRIMTDKQLQLAAKRLIEIEPKRKAEILATFEALSA